MSNWQKPKITIMTVDHRKAFLPVLFIFCEIKSLIIRCFDSAIMIVRNAMEMTIIEMMPFRESR